MGTVLTATTLFPILLSDIRESTARNDFFLDCISGPSTDKMTSWNLARPTGEFSQHFEGVQLGYLRTFGPFQRLLSRREDALCV